MLEILTPFKGEAVADELATALRRALSYALSYRPLCEAGRYRGYPRHSQVLLRSPDYRTLRRAYFLLLGGAKVNWSGAESALRGGLRIGDWLYEAWVFLELQRQIGVQPPRLRVRATRDGCAGGASPRPAARFWSDSPVRRGARLIRRYR
jgi:hypothetical protein